MHNTTLKEQACHLFDDSTVRASELLQYLRKLGDEKNLSSSKFSVTAIQHDTEIDDLKSMVASFTSELKSIKPTLKPKGNKMKYAKKQNESGDVH